MFLIQALPEVQKTAANGIKTKAAVQSEAVKCPKRQIKACLLYRLLFYPSTLCETRNYHILPTKYYTS